MTTEAQNDLVLTPPDPGGTTTLVAVGALVLTSAVTPAGWQNGRRGASTAAGFVSRRCMVDIQDPIQALQGVELWAVV